MYKIKYFFYLVQFNLIQMDYEYNEIKYTNSASIKENICYNSKNENEVLYVILNLNRKKTNCPS